MSGKFRTHYSNLQVAENASDEVIKGAYKYLTQKYHPDKNPGKEVKCKKVLQIITKAYKVLSDPELRKEHDEWIRQKREEGQQEKYQDKEKEDFQAQTSNDSEKHSEKYEVPIGAIQCPNCREFVGPIKTKRGSTIINLLLFLFFWPAWMIHFLYAYGYKDICPECGYVIRSDRRKARIIMGPIVGVLAIVVVWAVVTHVPYAPGCNDPQVRELVLEIAKENIDYPQIAIKGDVAIIS